MRKVSGASGGRVVTAGQHLLVIITSKVKKRDFFFFRCLMFILLDERQVKVSSLKLGGQNVSSIF